MRPAVGNLGFPFASTGKDSPCKHDMHPVSITAVEALMSCPGRTAPIRHQQGARHQADLAASCIWSATLEKDTLLTESLSFEGCKPMVHRSHSTDFKRQIAQDYLAGGDVAWPREAGTTLSRKLIRCNKATIC